MTHSPSIIFILPTLSFGLALGYLVTLEPSLVSEEILLFFVSTFFFIFILGLITGNLNFKAIKTFSSFELGVLKVSNLKLNPAQFFFGPAAGSFFGYNTTLDLNFSQSLLVLKGNFGLTSHLPLLFFLRTFFKLILPSELDIWRARFNWFFKLYTKWSELYGFFLNCNYNLFPPFTIPPDYRRIRTWRGRRLI